MKSNFIVFRLRKYLRRLYVGYPSHFFYGYEKIEGTEEGVKNLLEDNIIKAEEFQAGYKQGKTPVYGLTTFTPIMERKYRLTAEGLKLDEAWNIERLTYGGIILSLVILILTIWGLYFQIIR